MRSSLPSDMLALFPAVLRRRQAPKTLPFNIRGKLLSHQILIC